MSVESPSTKENSGSQMFGVLFEGACEHKRLELNQTGPGLLRFVYLLYFHKRLQDPKWLTRTARM